MKTITAPCKYCGKPATARFPDHAPQEAVDKWLPLLTHNHCADMLAKRRDSEEKIIHHCFLWHRMEPSEKAKKRDQTQRILSICTKRYAEAMTAIMELSVVMWTEDFVTLLMEQPDRCGRILHDYREQLRKHQPGAQP